MYIYIYIYIYICRDPTYNHSRRFKQAFSFEFSGAETAAKDLSLRIENYEPEI